MARILTDEEVLKLPRRKLRTIPVVIEQRTPFGKWDSGSTLKWVGSDYAYEYFQDTLKHRDWYTYGKTTRIWDAMPNREELQGAAWD